ncbi:SUF system NifU family Fe-S cluster assembly protein [Deinococcus sp. MIMF12]|uniref:SUF system NifU family Fe-S cluster assembly protein n=1 Tax=Deinococcus rhizophilus TaxID=3049544 RepID=A0ABT7JHP1_9DEIO|nr:SUF system NifU family Fe-S cluster assembly protein [Deinococcus rhizophilus]MDL2344575.1 SUF system NifU family Fe-S cluster assembly protein [Deinococcus rhizophilus]
MNRAEELYRAVILDHSCRPRHHGTLAAPTVTQAGLNASCGDRLSLQLRIEGGVIADVAFTGSGCAVSQGTASLMTVALRGRRVEGGLALAGAFGAMLRGADPDPALGDLVALQGVARLHARTRCALLPWDTFRAAVEQVGEEHGERPCPDPGPAATS